MPIVDLFSKRNAPIDSQPRGFLARTKAFFRKTLAQSLASLVSVPGSSRGWFPLIRETFTGAWQVNAPPVVIETVLANPTLYACVTLIANDVSKLRPMLMEQLGGILGVWIEIESAAFSPVLRKQNSYQTRADFFKWWMISKLVHGNTYVLKARDGRNVVVALHILDPARVRVLVAPDGSVFYELDVDELSEVRDKILVPAREIIHDRCCPLFHPLIGVSPIYAAGAPAMQGLTIRQTSATFFGGGSAPGGVLTAPGEISDAAALRAKTYWETEFSGDNAGKIAVLGDGLKFEKLAMTAQESSLVEQLKMTDEDICRAFHVPRWKVGVGPEPPAGSAEELNLQYWSDCIQEHVEGLELKLDEGIEVVNVIGRTLGIAFDEWNLIRMNRTAQMAFVKEGVSTAVFSPNDGRRFFDQPPVEGGDSPMLQQQMFSLEALAERDANKPFAKPDPPAPAPDAASPADRPADADNAPGMQAAGLVRVRTKFAETLRVPA